MSKTIYYKPLPPKQATLLIIEKKDLIRQICLFGNMTVGREHPKSQCQIRLASEITSRNHGEFIYNDYTGEFYYRDNNSLNGTFINGKKLEPFNESGTRAVKLKDGDILRIDRRKLNHPHPEAVMMIFSMRFDKEELWNRIPLEGKNEIPIGRNIRRGISLTDFMVSQNHAVLRQHGTAWVIYDNQSTNGVSVNGNEINSFQELHERDVIRIANTTLIFLGDSIIYNCIKQNSVRDRNVGMNVNIQQVVVHNQWKKKTLLKDINLDIERGDFVLILGGAGAGKSTFVKSLIGEMKAQGEIKMDGLDLYKNYKLMKHKIGIVPQFATVRMNDTVYDTIMDAAQIKLAGYYSKKEINERVEMVIEKMMLQEIRDSMVSVISGGQKKRVEIAVRSISDQSVFILDEPDSGVDVAGRMDLMENLKTCTKNGSIVAVISHMPNDAQNLFTKVIVLAKSKNDGAGHLAYYGDVPNALKFFEVNTLQDIVIEINAEGGKGRADEFIERFERMSR